MRPTNISISSVLIAIILSSSPASGSPALPRAQLCNGSPELCTTRYSAVTSVIGAHDSPFVGPLPADNQNVPTSEQLRLGARMLQAQTHESPDDPNVVQLCHTDCFLEDAGPLKDWLTEIKTFMQAPGNENEVVTLLLTNPDGMSLESFDNAFKESGADSLCFSPEAEQAVPLQLESWPSLGDMIASGKRMIVFMDRGADTGNLPYILDEFSYFFETPFGVEDPAFPGCTIHRPAGVSADGRMYIANHFLNVEIVPGIFVPDRLRVEETNSKASIEAETQTCRDVHNGRPPNFILLDFVDKGDWSRVAKPQEGFAEKAGKAFCGLLGKIGINC